MADAGGVIHVDARLQDSPIDPTKFELVYAFVNRNNSATPWGWRLIEQNSNLVLEGINAASPVSTSSLAAGDFVLSINGNRVHWIFELEDVVSLEKHIRIVAARRRQVPLNLGSYIPDVERKIGFEYFLLRLVCFFFLFSQSKLRLGVVSILIGCHV